MEFTDIEGWPDGVSEAGPVANTDATTALQRTILATWPLAAMRERPTEHLNRSLAGPDSEAQS